MITEKDYLKGIKICEQIKYTIDYNKEPLFEIVFKGLVSRLLSHEYSSELTDEQKELLNDFIKQ